MVAISGLKDKEDWDVLLEICFLFPNLKFSAQCPLFLLLPLFCFLFKVSTHDPTAKKLDGEWAGKKWRNLAITYVLFIE